ncbi:probable low-specificity L-threonine aldolase 2 isoform X1 [Stegodyphus dumicola]|uniref:probable low-specificity L-threonine aldolase 2 isoform X1 n=1 Tax=Stegodyphus dumicola TaxID=202533 RepID=UPI0015B030D2|nr:probable low-specificity L-threonine aldolase 2 isoform X1 [Stegodyphus dumicola]
MVKEVDLRSDTVTKPTAAMRRAMAEAIVGDDVHREDSTVIELEHRIADLLGKEDALFVPSGTMGNLSSVMSHCWTRGLEVMLGDQSHIFIYEQGGVSQLGGVHVSALATRTDGTFDMEEVANKIRPSNPRCHEPYTGLICLENTHNRCGGRVLPLSFIEQVCSFAHRQGVPVHMDGARILNASVHSGVAVKEIVKNCDSISMCLSKGIGAPVGSVVAGSSEFIGRVMRCRKVLGGGMRQAGVLAAAGLVALDTARERIQVDHLRAKRLAQDIQNLGSELIVVNSEIVESNMILLNFPSPHLTSEQFADRMALVKESDTEKAVVKVAPWFGNRVRCVLHSDLTEDDVYIAFRKIRSIAM